MTTATLVGATAPSLDVLALRQLDVARALATPVGVIAGPEQMRIWSVSSDKAEAQWLADVQYAGLDATQDRLRSDLAPQALLSAKRTARQLTLFPIDASLLTRARADTVRRLSSRVQEAIAVAARRDPSLPLRDVTRLVLAAAGAVMVRDKLSPDVEGGKAALRFACDRFPSFFGWTLNLPVTHQEILGTAIDDLAEGVDYASVDPAIISEVYENTLVTDAARQRTWHSLHPVRPRPARRAPHSVRGTGARRTSRTGSGLWIGHAVACRSRASGRSRSRTTSTDRSP